MTWMGGKHHCMVVELIRGVWTVPAHGATACVVLSRQLPCAARPTSPTCMPAVWPGESTARPWSLKHFSKQASIVGTGVSPSFWASVEMRLAICIRHAVNGCGAGRFRPEHAQYGRTQLMGIRQQLMLY